MLCIFKVLDNMHSSPDSHDSQTLCPSVHGTVPQPSAHHLGHIEIALHSAASIFTAAQRSSDPFDETGQFTGCSISVESWKIQILLSELLCRILRLA
jgi:hypothetical protein